MISETFFRVIARLREKRWTVSLMESCTGGCLADLLTDIPGASEVFPGGLVTYGNEAKVRCGVPRETLETYGVYSAETAAAMARAAMDAFGTDVSVGVTGSLNRADPANADSVPGEVWCAIRVGETTRTLFWDDIAAETRRECKMCIALRTAEELLDRLG